MSDVFTACCGQEGSWNRVQARLRPVDDRQHLFVRHKQRIEELTKRREEEEEALAKQQREDLRQKKWLRKHRRELVESLEQAKRMGWPRDVKELTEEVEEFDKAHPRIEKPARAGPRYEFIHYDTSDSEELHLNPNYLKRWHKPAELNAKARKLLERRNRRQQRQTRSQAGLQRSLRKGWIL